MTPPAFYPENQNFNEAASSRPPYLPPFTFHLP
ncbi:MAG: hypothetical protein RLZZ112_668 [Verrucomicrobiota bacterium]